MIRCMVDNERKCDGCRRCMIEDRSWEYEQDGE